MGVVVDGGAAAIDARMALLDRREALFAYTKRVSGANRQTELKPCFADSVKGGRFSYTIEPSSRYARLPADLPPPAKPASGGEEGDEDEEGLYRI